MNALPVGPHGVLDSVSRNRYFDDMKRWGFDIAYNAYYAFTYEDVIKKYREAYMEFVKESHSRGYPTCIQIQSTVCANDRLGIEEAQYDIDNNPEMFGEKGFFASFSSDAWKNYLKELTTIFIKDYGFDYVVFEEPMYRVDIPGSKDRFYGKFIESHPNMKYPQTRVESVEYLSVQQAKSEALLEFFTELVKHAKAQGADKVGIMPWFFIPTVENTPPGTLNTSCNIGLISKIPGLDVIVVRMQPDNIHFNVMRTGDEMQKSPLLYFTEVMAHALNKDCIAVSNPTDEHTDYPACPLIPLDFYRDCTLAAFAAAPHGFTRHWYGQNYGKDEEHMKVLSEACSLAGRLGTPKAKVAFVFSQSGTIHAEPFTYETVFPFYWALAKQMAFKAKIPMLTFHAETLAQNLADNPEVRVLILEEHFPLSIEQMMEIRDWWDSKTKDKLCIVAFGSGLGFSSYISSPGAVPCTQSLPGVLELIGLKQNDNPQLKLESPLILQDVSKVRRSAFLGDELTYDVPAITNAKRIFGSRANTLYETNVNGMSIPVVAEWRDRQVLAIFCGFGLSDKTAVAAQRAIEYALREVDCDQDVVDSCSEGILWNTNECGYVAISNLSDEEGSVIGNIGRAAFWDCIEHKLITKANTKLKLKPKSFGLFRIVGKRSKFFDIIGASSLIKLIDGTGRAELDIVSSGNIKLVLRNSPIEVLVDGNACKTTQELKNGVFYVTLQNCPQGERKISIKW